MQRAERRILKRINSKSTESSAQSLVADLKLGEKEKKPPDGSLPTPGESSGATSPVFILSFGLDDYAPANFNLTGASTGRFRKNNAPAVINVPTTIAIK